MKKKNTKSKAHKVLSESMPLILELINNPSFVKLVNQEGYQVNLAEIKRLASKYRGIQIGIQKEK